MELLEKFLEYMSHGGFVMWPLLALSIILWYALGYRYMSLKRGSKKSVRVLIDRYKKQKRKKVAGILDEAIVASLEKAKEIKDPKKLRKALDIVLYPYQREIKTFKTTIKTIVAIAPLIGLLGTVIGMIETFDSLAQMALYTQNGGIAAGISQALFTTQMGLVVAVPGLIAGRLLDHKEERLLLDFEQIKDILCTQEDEG